METLSDSCIDMLNLCNIVAMLLDSTPHLTSTASDYVLGPYVPHEPLLQLT